MDYDQSKYKVKTWKNLTLLHWILNPGLAFNELLFGQRIPKTQLIDKSSNKPLMERTYVPCPHCKTLLINIPVWILGGLAFGYTMKYWMGRRGRKSTSA